MNNIIDRFPRRIAWSEEDNCYVGRCPDLFLGGCHGATEAEVDAQLQSIIADVIRSYRRSGKPLPEPSNRAARLSGALSARRRIGLSQERFAGAIGIRVSTLRNWEQGKVQPRGAAATLLRVIDKHPEILYELAESE